MKKELLRVENISKNYSGEQVLKNVSFRLFQGETLVVLGANSAGKTTLMKILGGDVKKDGGTFFFDGEIVENHSISNARRLGIQMVYDSAGVVEDLSLAENLFLPIKKPFIYNPARLAVPAKHYLNTVGLSYDPLTPARELGVTDRSKLKLAGALAADPRLLILDEPPLISNPADKQLLEQLLKRYKSQGGTVILITHNLEDALFCGDRIMILRAGTAVFMDDLSHITKDLLISVLAQGVDSKNPLTVSAPCDEPCLEARNFSGASFHRLDFTVQKGEIVGFIGSAESGNIDILRALSGNGRYTGEVVLNGIPVHPSTSHAAHRLGITLAAGTLAAQYGLIPNMSISGNLSLRILRRITKAGVIIRRAERHFAKGRLRFLYTDEVTDIDTQVGELSNGVKHKLQLTEALSSRPKLLLLFDPTAGMDLISKQKVLRDIVSAAAEGAAVLFAGTTEDEEFLRACHRVFLMEAGEIRATLKGPGITVKDILTLEQTWEAL